MNTKEKIVKAALNIFLTQNYESASLSQIAKKVGISKPAIYYYYENKEKLYVDCVTFYKDTLSKLLIDDKKSEMSLKDFMKVSLCHWDELIKAVKEITGIENVRDFSAHNFIYWGIRNIPEIKEIYTKEQAVWTDFLRLLVEKEQNEGKIRSDIDADTLLWMISSVSEGLLMYHIFIDDFELQQKGEQQFDLICKLVDMKY